VKVTTHLHLVLRLRMSGAIPSWHPYSYLFVLFSSMLRICGGVLLKNWAEIYTVWEVKNYNLNFLQICVTYMTCSWTEILLLLLLLMALQPTVGFSLLSDFLPFCPFFTLLSPPSYSHYLQFFFNACNPSLPWSPSELKY